MQISNAGHFGHDTQKFFCKLKCHANTRHLHFGLRERQPRRFHEEQSRLISKIRPIRSCN